MSDFHGHEYNYEISQYPAQPEIHFKQLMRAGELATDFTLPSLDGGEVTLSDLQGKPTLIEFGSAS